MHYHIFQMNVGGAMSNTVCYLNYHGLPCRVFYDNGIPTSADLYQPGAGLQSTDIITVLEDGAVVSKSQYDNLCSLVILSP